MGDSRLISAPASRNVGPIADVLKAVLPKSGMLLEVASGSGQHAVGLARALPDWTILPTDRDQEKLASIEAYRADDGLPNLKPAKSLDVMLDPFPDGTFDAVLNINMIHISPWEACLGLVRGAAARLSKGGFLVFYGPFKKLGAHTAPSNLAFDEYLREQDPAWGVRDMEAVTGLAAEHGLTFAHEIGMPANNFVLVYRVDR